MLTGEQEGPEAFAEGGAARFAQMEDLVEAPRTEGLHQTSGLGGLPAAVDSVEDDERSAHAH